MQNKPLQQPTILHLSKKEGISNLETWVNVRPLLQTAVHNCLEDDELFLSFVVYSKYPLWVFVDINDSDCLRLSLKCLVMKVGLVMMESQDFKTHLNRVKDFTGRWPRMSSTTSSGTSSRIVVVVFRDITKIHEGTKSKVLGFCLPVSPFWKQGVMLCCQLVINKEEKNEDIRIIESVAFDLWCPGLSLTQKPTNIFFDTSIVKIDVSGPRKTSCVLVLREWGYIWLEVE